jgi:Reverse transcriptase (RNA-dependent DNA polymerase)
VQGRSTSHELVDILHHWHEALDNSNSIRAVILDNAKAFDHVDHCIVITKLKALGVAVVLTRRISSFLSNRHQRVKISDIFSDRLSLTGSMPHGAWLGPLIFIILINDLTAD